MWTGRQTLVSIESAITKLHGEEGQLDQALRSAISDADRLRKERSQGLRELARIKLDEMTAARLVSNLDAGERRAMQILDDYRMRMAATTEQREALLKEVAGAEAERNTAAAEVETALGAVETLRVQAEAKVQTTPEWRAAKTMRDEADAVATEAERRLLEQRRNSAPRRNPMMTTRYSPIYGAVTSEPPHTKPAASHPPSIASSQILSTSAVRGPTTRR